MHPLKAALKQAEIKPDPAQRLVVRELCAIFDQLVAQQQPKRGIWTRLIAQFAEDDSAIRGLYVWGGVGRGKTLLCDLFYECLPFENKNRLHFHRFMQVVHQRLKALKGHSEPLDLVAEGFVANAKVLCLDEMHVTDITDAMLIYGLLKALFARGVTLITTSNSPPDLLYKEGLQRDRFLPAIALLKQHTQVINLDGEIDYRLRTLEQAEIYHTPLDAGAEACLQQNFHTMVAVDKPSQEPVQVNDREIPTVLWAEDVAWFEFEALCNTPRSKEDYIEIARLFQTLIIANIPIMDQHSSDQSRRFINMIDEFYDRNVKLIVSAAAKPEALYTGKRLAFEFQRTTSRLLEMQSRQYLAKPHLP